MNTCVCVSGLSQGAAGACLPGNPGDKRASEKKEDLEGGERVKKNERVNELQPQRSFLLDMKRDSEVTT